MTKAHLETAEILAPLMRAEVEYLSFVDRQRTLFRAISVKMRVKRESKGVSVREMARRMGFSAAYVSDVELGRRNPTIAFADAFMEALSND